MQILPGLLNQDWVYWPPSTANKFGEVAPLAPRAIKGKSDLTRRVINTADGRTLEISTTVFLSTPVEERGWLVQTKFEDRPETPAKEHQIKAVSQHPDVDETELLWKAMI